MARFVLPGPAGFSLLLRSHGFDGPAKFHRLPAATSRQTCQACQASAQCLSHGRGVDDPARRIKPQLPVLHAQGQPWRLREYVLADQGRRAGEVSDCGVSKQIELDRVPYGSIDAAKVYARLQACILEVQVPAISCALCVEFLLRQACSLASNVAGRVTNVELDVDQRHLHHASFGSACDLCRSLQLRVLGTLCKTQLLGSRPIHNGKHGTCVDDAYEGHHLRRRFCEHGDADYDAWQSNAR
mmetsp:Transcript_94231/g.236484  ORF Transcript_94231/g.236484 Transcript_94231/m.236484 type:complete len:242 (-) Transcript_94231:1062-1787(-)